MTPLTTSLEYNEVWIAHEFNLLPSEFALLDWDEQEKLHAYAIIKQKIDAFYQYEQEQHYKDKENAQ